MNGSMTTLFLYVFVIVAVATNGIASSQLATNSSEIGIGLPHYIARAGSDFDNVKGTHQTGL